MTRRATGRLPILLQRAIIRLAYTAVGARTRVVSEADRLLAGLLCDGSPLPDSAKVQIRGLEDVRGAVKARRIINRFGAG